MGPSPASPVLFALLHAPESSKPSAQLISQLESLLNQNALYKTLLMTNTVLLSAPVIWRSQKMKTTSAERLPASRCPVLVLDCAHTTTKHKIIKLLEFALVALLTKIFLSCK